MRAQLINAITIVSQKSILFSEPESRECMIVQQDASHAGDIEISACG